MTGLDQIADRAQILALAELELFTGTGLTVFLPFDHACITGQVTGFFQRRTERFGISAVERSRNAVT
jgi:hypothetical protein